MRNYVYTLKQKRNTNLSPHIDLIFLVW